MNPGEPTGKQYSVHIRTATIPIDHKGEFTLYPHNFKPGTRTVHTIKDGVATVPATPKQVYARFAKIVKKFPNGQWRREGNFLHLLNPPNDDTRISLNLNWWAKKPAEGEVVCLRIS